jgi:DME family drug/metabolite transporter
MLDRLSGPALVLIAALLWGTDSLFRFPTAESLDPTFIVFCEHLIGILLLLPWIWRKHGGELFKLGWKEWFYSLIVGAGGGAIATVLFTASFRFLNPSVTILLQKLQPVFVVLLAYAFLGERPERKFYPWAAVALGAGFVLSFPDLDVSFLRERGSVHAKGVIYALTAAGIWGVSTVAGRALLMRTTSGVATFWRYFFGLVTLMVILAAANVHVSLASVATRQILVALAYLSVVTGVVPMLAYYAGMARTPASVVTFIELLYPVSAVILNTLILHTPLSPVQMGAGGALLFAVTMISV